MGELAGGIHAGHRAVTASRAYCLYERQGPGGRIDAVHRDVARA